MNKNPHDQLLEGIFQTLKYWTPNSHFKKKGQSRRTESPEREPVSARKTDRIKLDDEKLEFPAFILHGLTIRDFFILGHVSMPGEKLPDNRQRCEQNTHSYSMYRCAQCVSTHPEQYDHISSREHAWLKGAQLRVARIGVSK